MKNGKSLWGSISIIIGIVIAVLALVRGPLQIALLLTVFSLWGIWIVTALLLPYMREVQRRQKRQQRLKQQTREFVQPVVFSPADAGSEPVEHLLLRHVNYRISGYLRAAYPDVTWEWEDKKPENLVISGGIGRIRVYGVADFDHADVTVDQNANISCSMIKIVPLSSIGTQPGEENNVPPNEQSVDPQIWYEVQGRKVLEALMADLNSRGHSSVTLHDNGDICIEQNQNEVAQEHLSNFPQKVYWPRLVQVFERNGLAAEITAKGIQVSW